MENTLHCELLTWHQVDHLSKRLAEKIRASGFEPDIVVAVARGGYVPARLLCDALGLYALESLRIAHYEAGAGKRPEARLCAPLSVDVGGLSLLVVDDCSDTGDTLRLALEYLRGLHPKAIKVAVLHHKTASPIEPDYYGQKVTVWRWLIYPWAVVEDLGGFLAAMEPCPDSPEEALRQLQLHHGIQAPRRAVEAALAARNVMAEKQRG